MKKKNVFASALLFIIYLIQIVLTITLLSIFISQNNLGRFSTNINDIYLNTIIEINKCQAPVYGDLKYRYLPVYLTISNVLLWIGLLLKLILFFFIIIIFHKYIIRANRYYIRVTEKLKYKFIMLQIVILFLDGLIMGYICEFYGSNIYMKCSSKLVETYKFLYLKYLTIAEIMIFIGILTAVWIYILNEEQQPQIIKQKIDITIKKKVIEQLQTERQLIQKDGIVANKSQELIQKKQTEKKIKIIIDDTNRGDLAKNLNMIFTQEMIKAQNQIKTTNYLNDALNEQKKVIAEQIKPQNTKLIKQDYDLKIDYKIIEENIDGDDINNDNIIQVMKLKEQIQQASRNNLKRKKNVRYHTIQQALKSNLFSIIPKDKCVTKESLSLIYTPGVGAVCKAIQNNQQLINKYTNRKNSIAIVSDGGILNRTSKQIFPLMDWLIVQFKYYAGLDAYPFAVDKDINIEQAINDLGNSFGTILLLEKREPVEVSNNIRVLSYLQLSQYFDFSIENAEKAAQIITYLINHDIFGWINVTDCKIQKQQDMPNTITHQKYQGKLKGHTIDENSLKIHEYYTGKIQIQLNFFDINKLKSIFTLNNLEKVTAEQNPYSKSKNICAIVTDGTAILGFGNIGPKAGLPVMEGKSALFKHLGDVQVVPVCINPKKSSEEEIQSIRKLVCNFAAVNLQDISAPNCFKIEQGLKNFGFPVFHDDQHGTAIIVLAGLINATKVIEKPLKTCKIVINGAGAAGTTVAKLLVNYGISDVIVCDTKGSIFKGRNTNMNKQKQQLANITNKNLINGDLSVCLTNADIFVGVSAKGALKGEWIPKMNPKNIVFALANPFPEIMPDEAKSNGAYIVATGRSDFENQINNSLVFPGVFRGILDNNIKCVTTEMKVAAAQAIAKFIETPTRTNIIPSSLDPDMSKIISQQIQHSFADSSKLQIRKLPIFYQSFVQPNDSYQNLDLSHETFTKEIDQNCKDTGQILILEKAVIAHYHNIIQKLKSNLFSIVPKDKCVTKESLSLIYTPGVGAVCKAIQNNQQLIDTYTNRKNSIAIVSDGGILNRTSKQIFPLMDWLIVQFKYYAGLDAYPFAVDKDINIEQAINDLGNSFGTILLLEKREPVEVSNNIRVLSYLQLSQYFDFSIENAEKAAQIITYLINHDIFGWINVTDCKIQKQQDMPNTITHQKYQGKLKGHTIDENSLKIHQFYQGKIHIELNFFDINKLKSIFTLNNMQKVTAEQNPYSKSKNICAIVTDGTAILGFGNIGPKAGLPVIEGKAALFKHLGDVQVVPVCINPKKSSEEEIQSIRKLVGNFAAVNLQDISAPNCFKIEQGLKNFGFPVFHDDQHGTAIIVLAGLINATKVIEKPLKTCKIVINGAGAAGTTVAKLLVNYGVSDVIVCDTKGSIFKGRTNMNKSKQQLANITNKNLINGDLSVCLTNADIFVGVSAKGALKGEWIPKMNPKNIVFALANPFPEIMPDEAKSNGAYIVATGRSDFENQINNSLVFPGVFRGILDNNIKCVTTEMKIAAAQAIAKFIETPTRTNIIPSILDPDMSKIISSQMQQLQNFQI